MKLVFCLPLFFLLEMFEAKRITHKSTSKPHKRDRSLSIPLTYTPFKTANTGSKSARRYHNLTDKWGEGVHLTNFTVFGLPNVHLNVIFDPRHVHSWAYWKYYESCDENALDVQTKKHLIDLLETNESYEADFYHTRGGWVFGYLSTSKLIFTLPESPASWEPAYRFGMPILKVVKASKNVVDQPFDAVIGVGPGNHLFDLCRELNKPLAIGLALPPLRLAQSSPNGELVLCERKPTIRELEWPAVPQELTLIDPKSLGLWKLLCKKIVMDKFSGDPHKGVHTVQNRVGVYFDWNTPYFIVPKFYLNIYKTLVNVTEDPITKELKVSCANTNLLPAIGFEMKTNVSFYLMGDDYILHKRLPDNTQECQVLIKENSGVDPWEVTMGDIFMRRYFVTFYTSAYHDPDYVGGAKIIDYR